MLGRVGKPSAPALRRSAFGPDMNPGHEAFNLVLESIRRALQKISVITLRWSGGALRLPTFPTCKFSNDGWSVQG